MKITATFTHDEWLCLMFALKKTIHYTMYFDPSYFPLAYVPLKNQDETAKYLDEYRAMFFNFRKIACSVDKAEDMPFNAKIEDDDLNEDTLAERILTKEEIKQFVKVMEKKDKK